METPHAEHGNHEAPAAQTVHRPTQPMYTPLHEPQSQRPMTEFGWPLGQMSSLARPARKPRAARLTLREARARATRPRTTKKGKPTAKTVAAFAGEGFAGTNHLTPHGACKRFVAVATDSACSPSHAP